MWNFSKRRALFAAAVFAAAMVPSAILTAGASQVDVPQAGTGWTSSDLALAPALAPSEPVLVSAASTTGNRASYPLGTSAFTAGHLYVAFITLSDGGGATDPTPGITGDGTTWSKIDAGEATAGAFGLTAYWFIPSADVTSTLSTGNLQTVHEGLRYTIVDIAGDFASQYPFTQHIAARRSPATSFTLPLPSPPASDSLVIGAFAHARAEESAPADGWIEVAGSDGSHVTPPRGSHVVYDATTPANDAGSSWATSTARRAIVLEIPGEAPTPPSGVTVVTAGDICGDFCANTAERVIEVDPEVVVGLGDLSQDGGLLSDYVNTYGGGTDPQTRWGTPSIKDITLPGYGNHDCADVPPSTGAIKQGCTGAVAYFGPDSNFGTDIPGTSGTYYTVVGEWLIVQLNSAGDIGSGRVTAAELEAQNTALAEILAGDSHTCELVTWHHPRYSSGTPRNQLFIDPWIETAYAGGVDIVLSGHAHDYERFAPQNGNGKADANGIRAFVVGTGGDVLRSFGRPQPNSLVRIVDHGILRMELGDDEDYSFAFLDDMTGAVDDSGTGNCHG